MLVLHTSPLLFTILNVPPALLYVTELSLHTKFIFITNFSATIVTFAFFCPCANEALEMYFPEFEPSITFPYSSKDTSIFPLSVYVFPVFSLIVYTTVLFGYAFLNSNFVEPSFVSLEILSSVVSPSEPSSSFT